MARPSLNDDERALRRTHLLAAAKDLYEARGELPTVAEIAEVAGVAKGTVYLSFRTKEEIFVALLEDQFMALIASMSPMVLALPGASALDASAAFAQAFAQQIQARPALLSLAAMTQSVLEKNLPLEPLLSFKERIYGVLAEAGKVLDQRLGRLHPGVGQTLLMRSWALSLGLWQAQACPTPLLGFVQTHPEHPLARLMPRHDDLATQVREAVQALWLGTLQLHPNTLATQEAQAAQEEREEREG